MSAAPKVFISYSHDSQAHRDFVRGLADRLCNEGVECLIDQYINGFPPEGWQTWMENQIESADFVLLVCTDTYLRRYRKQETDGGKGVTFEGVVVSQHLYDAHYHNAKFIPVIPKQGSFDHVPVPLRAYSTYCLPDQYDDVYRVVTEQAQYLQPKLGTVRKLGRKVAVDRLPTVIGDFFGREVELALLDEALSTNNTRIIQFIASGGTGKTKLLRHWLNQHQDDIGNYIVWSFYSQGTSDSKQVSATPLFTEAFKAFGVDANQFTTDEDRADALLELLLEHQCLLVLDGLEPLQQGGSGFDGQLKDRAMKRLLQGLAQQHTSLCIITTRISVHDIRDRVHVLSHPLDNLRSVDGVQLLRSLGVQGNGRDLTGAVTEVEGHALTLHLLGNAITTYLEGDIRKRDTLDELVDDFDEQGRHAFKVMQAYQHWLRDDNGEPTAELQLLYLLGLFDHPVEVVVLQVLWDEHIVGLTAGIPLKAWKVALRDLREKHCLLSQHGENPHLLDCHPLIREYFGRQLEENQPETWQQAHKALYHYYKALPEKKLPDTLEEMQPLFHAVVHGCASGLYPQVMDQVFRPRIRRKSEFYTWKKLGAFNDDLSAVSNFFSQPWKVPVECLSDTRKGFVLSWAGFCLRSMGRLCEAVEPMQAGMKISEKQKDWKGAAIDASNLSELQLTLGHIAAAVTNGKRSAVYADRSGDMFWCMCSRITYADALQQAGEEDKALTLFLVAEQLQQEYQPEFPNLYSWWGFRYRELLLSEGKTDEALGRAKQDLKWAKYGGIILLRVALCQLTLGRAHHAKGDLPTAHDWLEQAVLGLREAGQQDDLPRGLLARAALHRDLNEFDKALQDLTEVWKIAEPSEMRLFQVDYHLEMARLLFANSLCLPPFEGENLPGTANSDWRASPFAKGGTRGILLHISEADRLVKKTGYHRRDPELAALKAQLKPN